MKHSNAEDVNIKEKSESDNLCQIIKQKQRQQKGM